MAKQIELTPRTTRFTLQPRDLSIDVVRPRATRYEVQPRQRTIVIPTRTTRFEVVPL